MTNPAKRSDPRRAAWKAFRPFCEMLSADPCMMPYKDGKPNWEETTRDSLEKLAHWSDMDLADISRLAALTDSFEKFIGEGNDASVVTPWNEGMPDAPVQIDGEPCERALDVIREAIAHDLSLNDLCELPKDESMDEPLPVSAMMPALAAIADRFEKRNDLKPAPVAANDNDPAFDERLVPFLAAFGGPGAFLSGDAVYGAVVENMPGQIRVLPDGKFLFVSKRSSRLITLPVAPKSVKATPFSLGDPAALPQRDWLYGKHYIRRYLTATVGAGGGGKSAHAVSETLAMVTGRLLLDTDGALSKPLRVWYINAEDPQDEIDRRFHAAAKHFGVTAEQIADRLYTDSGRDQEFVIMKQEGRDLKVCQPLIDEMVAEIQRRKIDVVIVDPFVSTHEVAENDNGAMQRVAKAWTEVADRGNCGVEVIHHVAKNQGEVTADSARGGGALKDKTRGMRVLNAMTDADAAKVGLEKPDGYFRIDHGKVNLVASGQSQWRRFVSVPLMNGKGLLNRNGDEIGVVEAWRWPSASVLAERAAEQRLAVVADVPDATLAGFKVRLGASDYKANEQANNWAGKLVAELFGLDIKQDKAKIKAMLAAWIDTGELEIVDMLDAYRHVKPHIKPAAAP